MNHIYRVVWNACKGLWQVVSEIGSGRLRSSTTRARRRAARRALSAAALTAASAAAWAGPLPTGAQVTAGQANVTYAGSSMTVNQTSQKAALDWSSFSIGQGHAVTFVQPSSASVALNRVTGADPSTIQGALNANGHVFLVNPNGVLFSPTAQVNVGGLLASTLSMSTDDFLAGRYRLAGASTATVENQGAIRALEGGNVALVAARVVNTGQLAADKGNVLLGAGSDVLVDFGGPVKLQVQKGALDALVENGGAIRADGGTVMLTAKSAGELAGSVINNTGIVEARTLATGERGQIMLLGDMETGLLHAGGTLDASAPVAGDGGAIETSAAHVDTAANLVVKAGAAAGKGGEWLVDPYDYTIGQTQANTIVAALNGGTSVMISTQSASSASIAGASGSGDITVSSAIAKTQGGDATLTLRADRNIAIGADITSTSGKLNLTLSAANAANATTATVAAVATGGVTVGGNLTSNGGTILIGGGNGTSTNGIGYALNTTSTTPAITIGTGKSILSGGGDITINGRSLVGANNGSMGFDKAGVLIRTSATIKSGTGNLLINGESDGGIKTFGLAFEGGSNTVTTLGSSSGGTMLLNGVNATTGNGITQADRDQGAVGMVAFGSRDQVVLQGASVAGWLVYVNGAPQLSAYTQAPQLSSCPVTYPNCGTMVIPGSNNSYLYATYQSVDMATHALYVTQSGVGTKVYDGTTTATGLTYGVTTDITGFSLSSLSPTPAFTTPSKNVGTYTKLVGAPTNPTNYTTGGVSYAVGYFNTGSYTITPKTLTPTAADKVYDGNTTAAVGLSGAIAGDAITATGTGTFASKDVGTYTVSVSGITLGGTDAGNYSLSGNSASATASITPRTVTLSGTKTYDGTADFSGITIGNLLSGESLTATGVTANSANVAGATYFTAAVLGNGTGGLAGNYQLPSLSAAGASNAAAITPKALSITGLSALDKVYDGTTSAQIAGGTLSGLVGLETLTLGSLTGAFATKDVGANKTVQLSNVALVSGTGLASNYTFAQPSGVTASITQKALTVSGITAANKVYDGGTSATVDASQAVLTGLVNGDTVTTAATGTFADKDAGTGKTVNLSSTHGGADVGNYTITDQASTTAAITPKALTATGMAPAAKTYDGTTSATLSGGTLSGLIGSETLTITGGAGSFADANAGTNKAVTVGSVSVANGSNGGLASNYAVTQASATAATITPKALSITGLAASDKVYDGTTTAQLSGGTLSGLVGSETLIVTGVAGSFAD
jgi:filamentous hemagglutinin family protein